jgi:PAS domain S-box-containing protein
VIITDAQQPDHPVIYVNAAFEHITGYAAHEVVGRNCRFLQGPQTDAAAVQRIRTAIRSGQGVVETLLNHRKDGSVFVNHLVVSPIRDAEQRLTHFVGVQADVTTQKKSEDSLRVSEERYRLLAENSTDMIGRTSIGGKRLYLSPASRELLGYEPEELINSHVLDIAHPDDAAMVETSLKNLLSSASGHQTVTYRLRHKDGHWVWLESRRRLVRDEHGRPVEFVSVARDVNQRLLLEEQLRQAQKMEAVGQLTGGLAHDFNNLLTVILGNAEILAEKAQDQELRGLAEMIQSAAERGSDLTQKLLSFGRRQSLTPKALSLREVLSNLEGLLRRVLGEHIELDIRAPESRWLALADRAQLESAILNLTVNARDAMPTGGVLRIETDEVAPGRGMDVHSLSITVSDTGTGMAPAVLKHAFEPFFTTKDMGKGSGLGLSMVYGFAQQSGGHVWISSRVGTGTSVTIVLPALASALAEAVSEADAVEPIPDGKERILVVEDDPQVLQFVTTQLVSLGYDVTAVSVGVDAIERIERDSRYDLLFTDVVLPKGMSGVELARRAKQMRPSMKVLLTSGYPEEVFEQHGRPDEGTLILRKPYRRKELADTLRQILE